MNHPDAEQILLDVARQLDCTPEEVMRRFAFAAARMASREEGREPTLFDAEEILLGELLTGAQDFMSVAGVLSTDHFPRPRHKLIFKSMATVHESGAAISTVTIANELMKEGRLEESGGLTYLVKLTDYDG